ncbi:MAG: ArnT family glycosyltransferase [Arcobacter sp.]|uniref:ArnT family glycosyltransferase n=1 Tax=Arcobacter sp. TaxID=1872629 RepID=UPI003CFD38AD
MIANYKYSYYFYTFLIILICTLLIKADLSLSISYKEALNVFVNNSILTIITNTSMYFFGQNDIALRLPFILFYFFSVILMYKITDNYFKNEKDRLLSIIIFMLLPGVLSASLLVNSAIIVIFCTLLYLYYFQKYNKQSYLLLILFLFVDNSFAILYLALFFFSIKNKDKKLLYFSSIFFIISMYIYGFSTDGKPKGFLVDTVAVYATIFSPILFLYFIYAIYRAGIKNEKSLSWYISFTALLLSIIISFRQKVYIEDFAPYVVISIPLMIKTFLHSYRVRLREFRKIYNILAISIILMLTINVILTFVNKPLYMFLPNPTKHFVYQYHFVKELSEELKKRNIDGIISDNDELILRLRFYNIHEGDKYYISTKEFYNYDEKITIKYYGRELFVVYLKKIK